MEPFISESVLKKLMERHNVAASEVLQCFANRCGPSLIDNRDKHLTDPKTRWFIAETDMGRKLKVAYIPYPDGPVVKSAFPPNAIEFEIYRARTGVCF